MKRIAVHNKMMATWPATKRRDWRYSIVAVIEAAMGVRIRNLATIANRRSEVVREGGSPPRALKGTNRTPRIVLLTEFYPSDPVTSVSGAFQRLRCHLEGLAKIASVDLVFFCPKYSEQSPSETVRREAAVKSLWSVDGRVRFIDLPVKRQRRPSQWIADLFWASRGVVGFYRTEATMRTCGPEQTIALHNHLQELQPDLIFAHRLGAAAPLMRRWKRPVLPPVVVDIDDLEDLKLRRLAASMPRSWRKLIALAESWLALHALRQAGKLATRLLVASELDRSRLGRTCKGASIAVIPNTASRFGMPPKATGPVAVFVGTMNYPPNSEGLLWLIQEIWPWVRQRIPDARLLVAGVGSEKLVIDCRSDGVESLGFVSDLASVYRQATVAVCPVRRGSGTRIKIIEAAMNGIPVVSTQVGAEGLSFLPNIEIFLDDKPQGFADSCVRLMLNPDLAVTVGHAALKRAEEDYRRELVAGRLADLCLGLINSVPPNTRSAEDTFERHITSVEIG